MRNAADASSCNLYKQTATDLFFYAEINLNGGTTGKRWIINPPPPLLYAQWDTIFTKSSYRVVLENREDGLSWQSQHTHIENQTKSSKPKKAGKAGRVQKREVFSAWQSAKRKKTGKKVKNWTAENRQLLRWNLNRMACTAYN